MENKKRKNDTFCLQFKKIGCIIKKDKAVSCLLAALLIIIFRRKIYYAD